MLFRRVKVITILLMVFMMSIGCSRRKEVSIEPKKETKTTAEKSSSKETICVYVCGEVKHPGVYRFSKGERIVSAVKAAGGLTKKASAESINQAEKMKDGQQKRFRQRNRQRRMKDLIPKQCNLPLERSISILQVSRS